MRIETQTESYCSHREPGFYGSLAVLGDVSDTDMKGARGRRVLLPKAVILEQHQSLIGMPVSFRGIDRKCGVITSSNIVGRYLMVGGYLYAQAFPEIMEAFTSPGPGGALGMSLQMTDCEVDDASKEVWTLSRLRICGAEILPRDEASFKQTYCRLVGGNG